jgi:hypothetical protein
MKTLLSTWLAFGTIAALAQTQWINQSIPYQPTHEQDRFIVGGAYLKQVLAQQAPGFEQVDLLQARHEIHNETATIRDAVGKRTLLFLSTYFSAITTPVASRGAN